MAFKINEFQANINRTGGVALQSSFKAFVFPPAGIETVSNVDTNHLSFRIDSVEFPQRSITPIEFRDYGPLQKIGGQPNFIEITMSVIMSPDLREREFFLSWQDMVVGKHRKEFLNRTERKREFDIGYFDDYKGSVEVRQYDVNAKSDDSHVYSVKLYDSYPQLIAPLNSNWQNADVLKMNITMSFRYFTEDYRGQGDLPTSVTEGPFGRINRSGLGGALGTIAGVILSKTT